MIGTSKGGRAVRRLFPLAAVAGALAFASAQAAAGECPADKVVASGKGQQAGATMPKDVTDTVLAAVDLGKEIKGLDGRKLRTRMLVVQPGGEVPWHSHADRPALIYVLEGEVKEYSSRCAVPIVHRAGEVSREAEGISHYWINEGREPAVLLSADVKAQD
jgi:quercetin dioxygenase-like cupin family protein